MLQDILKMKKKMNNNKMKTEAIDVKELKVKTELDCGFVIIRLYKVPYGRICNRNITCENRQGNMIWQVEDICTSSDASFVTITPFDNEKIIAYNWIGMYYYINIQTGKLDLVNKNARPW